MTLIEAVRSGRPFRRKNWSHWLTCEGDQWVTNVHNGRSPNLPQDILADDWEIQEPKVTITRGQFWEAIADTYKAFPGESIIRREHAELLARKLGLEDAP